MIAGKRFADLTSFLPGSASDALAGGTMYHAALQIEVNQLQGGVVLAAYAILVLGLGLLRSVRWEG